MVTILEIKVIEIANRKELINAFPRMEGQVIRVDLETKNTISFDLGHFDDTAPAQEKFLNDRQDVIEYEIYKTYEV